MTLHVQPEHGVISRDENRFRCVKMGEIQKGGQNVKLCVDVEVIRTETTVQCVNISSLKEKNKID